MWQRLGPTNEEGTCLWCGRKLRREHATKMESTEERLTPKECFECGGKEWKSPSVPDEGFECRGCDCEQFGRRKYKVKSRKPIYDKPGSYGDGYFCGLRCGFQFGVAFAGSGRRLEKKED